MNDNALRAKNGPPASGDECLDLAKGEQHNSEVNWRVTARKTALHLALMVGITLVLAALTTVILVKQGRWPWLLALPFAVALHFFFTWTNHETCLNYMRENARAGRGWALAAFGLRLFLVLVSLSRAQMFIEQQGYEPGTAFLLSVALLVGEVATSVVAGVIYAVAVYGEELPKDSLAFWRGFVRVIQDARERASKRWVDQVRELGKQLRDKKRRSKGTKEEQRQIDHLDVRIDRLCVIHPDHDYDVLRAIADGVDLSSADHSYSDANNTIIQRSAHISASHNGKEPDELHGSTPSHPTD